MRRRWLLTGLVLTAALAGATTQAAYKGKDYSQRLAQVTAVAGEPVDHVEFRPALRPYDWEPIGDGAVVIWQTRSKAWLVDLEKSDSCRDLDWNIQLVIDSPTNSLSTHNGYLRTRYGWCKMIKIRPVDVAALKQSEHAAHSDK